MSGVEASSGHERTRRIAGAWTGVPSGLLGVGIFSLTLPATRIAVGSFDGVLVGIGRGVVAALLAGLFLAWRRAAWPRREWRGLCLVAACVVLGFPLLTSLALRSLPASHGAIVIGLLPLSTATFATLFARERLSVGFWLIALAGSATVIVYAWQEGGGTVGGGDVLLLGAVACAGAGYAEGGRLARTLGGPQVIAWALVLSLPALLPITVWRLATTPAPPAPTPEAVVAFGYLSVFSMFLGFFAWYRGLALGGIARVGQLQLLQPFLSVIASALLLHEALGARTVGFALVVVAWVAIGRRLSSIRPDRTPAGS